MVAQRLMARLAALVLLSVGAAAKRYGQGLRLLAGGGAVVRLYAPAATAVCVTGEWNGWSSFGQEEDVLKPEGGGWWSGTLAARPLLAAGAGYKFAMRVAGGEVLRKPDPWSRSQDGETLGNSLIYDDDAFPWTDGNWTMPAHRDLVIYELHVGTFGRIAPSTVPSTLRDCARFLDHLVDLGANAVELMPVAEFDGDVDAGYTTGYPYAVEHAYGGPDAFKFFVNECHARGISVILDVVYNHWGPMDLPLWRFDGWSDEAGLGGIYFYNDGRGATPWGHTRPNFGLEHVRDYVRENALFWLDTMRCDGLRVDGVSWIRMWGGQINRSGAVDNPEGVSLLREILAAARALPRKKVLIAEDLVGNVTVTDAAAAGGLGFDSQWDASSMWALRAALTAKTDDGRRVASVRKAVTGAIGGGSLRVVYAESHDDAAAPHSRLTEEVAPGAPASWKARKMAALGAALTLTSPGIPMLFQGQEILEDGQFSPTRPLDWTKLAQVPGFFRLYQDLVALRRKIKGFGRGLSGDNTEVFLADDDEKVVAFRRWSSGGLGDDTVVVLSLRNRSWPSYRVGLPAAGCWMLAFDSDRAAYGFTAALPATQVLASEPVPAQGLPQSAAVRLAPYTCLVYVLAGPPLLGAAASGPQPTLLP